MSVLLWICTGALGLFFGFPNTVFHAPVLALVYPAALYALGTQARSRAHALRTGWMCGLLGASAGLVWLAEPVQNVGGLPLVLALPCAVCIGAYVGLYGGLFSVCAHTLRHNPARILALGLVWYLLEFARGTVLTGFPWLTLAAAFAPWPAMIQGAAYIGAYALGGVFAAAACLLASPWVATDAPQRWRSVAAGVLLLAICAGLGTWRLAQAPVEDLAHASTLPGDAFAVIMAEGNIDQNQKWEPALQENTTETYLRLSREALAAYGAQYPDRPAPLLIWPETSMPFFVQSHPRLTPRIRDFAREHELWLVLGAPGGARGPNGVETYNRAFLIGPSGELAGWYDKEHLVPFGEFLPPALNFAFLAPLLQGVGAFTPGRDTAPLHAGTLALGVLICYEAIFPEITQQRVADGANVLVNISNDGWFGDSAAPRQHLELAALRAVEQNRWLVRGTNTGIAAVIDGHGRIVMRGAQFREQALTGFARRSEARTVFFALGPWLPLVAALLLVLCLCLPKTSIPPKSCYI